MRCFVDALGSAADAIRVVFIPQVRPLPHFAICEAETAGLLRGPQNILPRRANLCFLRTQTNSILSDACHSGERSTHIFCATLRIYI
ncbi:hypothetical protein RSAG8_08766, partial [Rhizoctonia solani AG-8 WAC10335]